MQLVEFLNERSIANLQTLQWYWAPSSRRSSSKGELLRLLRRQMLDAEQVRRCFEALEPVEQDFLKALLRCEDYEGEASALVAKLPNRPSPPNAERELLEDLRRRGFIAFTIEKNWAGRETAIARMPQELGDCLAEALNLDIRNPAAMLSLERRLAEVPALERPSIDDVLGPDSIAERIASLPDDGMRALAEAALTRYAGVLPLARFPVHGLDIEDVDSPAWRKAFEERFLGTFGHLSLLDYGLGDDHDCLVLYQEIVEAANAAAPPLDGEPDQAYACSLDFLTDLLTLVDFVRVSPSKLTSAGRFFRAARNQLATLSALRWTFFMDEDELISLKVSVARRLGLVELRGDGRLHATKESPAWEARPPEDQLREVFEALVELVAPQGVGDHFAALASVALEVLGDCAPGVWFSRQSFWNRVVSRYVLKLVGGAGGSRQGATRPWELEEPRPTLAALSSNAGQPLIKALNCVGALDIGAVGTRFFLRRGSLADVVAGRGSLPEPAEPLLMVNPDFEVIVLPEPGHQVLVHRLCGFCERGKREVTHHLRLTRESVQRGVLRGLGAEAMVATLRQHSRVPLAQNIEYSVRNWADSVHAAKVETVHILEFPSAELAETAMHLPELAAVVERRLSPTVLVLRVAELGPEAEDALKELGIHLT